MVRTVRLLLVILAVSLPLSASAMTIFEDDFDAESGSGDGASGQSEVGYSGFSHWVVTDGSVDLIFDGDFGIDCPGGAGKCVDLDGNTNDAGVMTTAALFLAPGSYELRIRLAGVSTAFTSSAAQADNLVDVSVGSLFSDTITVTWGEAPTLHIGGFTVTSAIAASIAIGNQGGDQFGAMLDDVQLVLIPEPQTGALVALGMAGLGMRARRTRD